MEKKRIILLFVVISFILLLLSLVFSAGVGIIITKPLNQSYNYLNHTINVTTSAIASSCRYIVNASTQGIVWQQLTSSASWAARYWHTIAVAPNGTIWLAGGYSGATYYNDVWYSTDGNTWVQATASASWPARGGHGFLIKSDGSMWIFGGLVAGVAYNDVWNSTNGVTWTLVNSSVAWENRSSFQSLITSDNVMWLIGGENASNPTPARKGDVWNSSNGADWKLVNDTAIPARKDHAAVVGVNNRMWVTGGTDGGSYNRDVWYSDNGLLWYNVTSAIPWGGRYAHASVFTPSDARIWVMGGKDSDAAGYRNDVWYSQDGGNWTQATSSAQWSQREYHPAIAMKNGTLMTAGGYYGANLNDIWLSAAPVAMDAGIPNGVIPWGKGFNASEGSNFIGVECNDSSNIWNGTNVSFYVDTQSPIVTISNPANMTYNVSSLPVAANSTVSETASACLSSLNGAANLTMNGSGTTWGITLAFAEGSSRVVVSCNDTINLWNSSSISFFVDSIKPVLNITSPFNITYTYTNLTVNVTTNESAQICRYAHNVTYEQNWTRLNSSAFSARKGHTIVNLNGTLWLIGGSIAAIINDVGTTIYLNDTWNSTDGISWTRANASTAFAARADHVSAATSDGRLWVIGGYDGTNYYNDSWYSSNGVNWIRANNSIFAERYAHASVVDSSGRIWVFGGISPAGVGGGGLGFGAMAGGPSAAPINSTWYSSDGGNWTRANASTGIASRSYAGMAATSDGRIWIIGGKNSANTGLNDVWYSSDGANWTRATSSAEWPARYGHISFSTPDNRLWVIGGTDGTNYYNDVWYSGNGTDWKIVNSTSNSSFWTPRENYGGIVKNNTIYIAGGIASGSARLNDSWSTPIPPWYRDMEGSGTAWGKNFTAAQGSNNVKVRCWDTIGNLNATMLWFTVDILGPAITITSPLNQSYTTSSTTITVATGESASTCAYSLNGAANVTMSGSGTSWSATATASNGGNTLIVSCQDSLGNWNSNSVAFSASFAVCGNQACESGETSSSCPGDCPASGGGTAGGGGGGEAEKSQANFYDLKANVPVEKQITDEKTALTKIEVTAKEDANNVKISIEKKDAFPEKAKEPAGKVYQILDIKLETEVEVRAELCFSVGQEWLKEQDAQKEDVMLAHYKPRIIYNLKPVNLKGNEMRIRFEAAQEDWEYLPTEIAKEDSIKEEKSIEYCAETTKFSTYAIIAKKPEIQEFLTVIQPVVEEQIIKPREGKILRKHIDLWGWRIPIAAVIDIILILGLVSIMIYERRIEYIIPEPAEVPEITEALPVPAKERIVPEKELVEFAKDSLLKGYSGSDIIKNMEAHRIGGERGGSAIQRAYGQICRMSEYELVPHVTEYVMRGYPDEQIKAVFMKNGVSAKCVASAIKAARGHISKASASAVLPFVQRCVYSGIEDKKIKEMLMKHGIREKRASDFIKMAHDIRKEKSLNL